MNLFLTLTTFVVLVVCIAVVILLLRRSRGGGEKELKMLREEVRTMSSMLSEAERTAAEAQDRRLADMQRQFSHMQLQNEQKLEQVRVTVDKRIAGMQMENNRRLEEVDRGLGEMKKLAGGVEDLSRILSNVKTRGILGEVQLGAILSQILAPEQYEENVATRPGDTHRVEYAVKLPGNGEQPVWLPIDAKFPADAYGRLVDAYETRDEAEIQKQGRELERRICRFAKDIRDKYVEPPSTTDFAIMFLPIEGLYAEVVRRGLVERLQNDYKVNIAGPTTMAALLNSLQVGFRTPSVQRQSGLVWKALAQVKAEVGRFEHAVRAAQNRIDQTGRELDRLVGVRTRAINRSLREVSRVMEEDRQENEVDEHKNDIQGDKAL